MANTRESRLAADDIVEAVAAEPEETVIQKKRPGRKPGSKNKPKDAALADKSAKGARKEVATPEIYVQYGADEASIQNIVEQITAEFVAQGHRASSIKGLKVYLKPEESAAYYVINEKVAGRVNLF